MYYYYYYDSFVQLNFKFLENFPEGNSNNGKISMNNLEILINCINELNRCAIENSTQSKFDPNIHSLVLKKISYNSPLDLSVIVPLATSIFGVPYLILKSIEKINDIKFKSEKHKLDVESQRLEIEKLRIDNIEKRKNRIEIPDEKISQILDKMILDPRYKDVIKKWEKLPFKLVKFDVQMGFEDDIE